MMTTTIMTSTRVKAGEKANERRWARGTVASDSVRRDSPLTPNPSPARGEGDRSWGRARVFAFFACFSLNRIARLQDRQHSGQDDEEDDDRQEDDEQGFEDRREALGGGVDLLVVGGCEAVEHLFEATGLLAEGEDLDDH